MNVLFSSTSSLPIGEVSVLIWATIGGILVFVGLAVEKFADWMNDRYLGGTEKPHQSLETTGWCVLMFGIFVEITVAGWSANDAWQTRQMAIRNGSRFITGYDRNLFIHYLKNYPKGDVKVIIGMADTETETYANEIRQMLDQAGYRDEKNGNIIRLENGLRFTSNIGDPMEKSSSDLYFAWFGQSKTNVTLPYFSFRRTNGYVYIACNPSITNDFRGAPVFISQAFQKIGIVPGIVVTEDIPVLSKDGEWGIFINQKF